VEVIKNKKINFQTEEHAGFAFAGPYEVAMLARRNKAIDKGCFN
jgi:hypothetical protein